MHASVNHAAPLCGTCNHHHHQVGQHFALYLGKDLSCSCLVPGNRMPHLRTLWKVQNIWAYAGKVHYSKRIRLFWVLSSDQGCTCATIDFYGIWRSISRRRKPRLRSHRLNDETANVLWGTECGSIHRVRWFGIIFPSYSRQTWVILSHYPHLFPPSPYDFQREIHQWFPLDGACILWMTCILKPLWIDYACFQSTELVDTHENVSNLSYKWVRSLFSWHAFSMQRYWWRDMWKDIEAMVSHSRPIAQITFFVPMEASIVNKFIEIGCVVDGEPFEWHSWMHVRLTRRLWTPPTCDMWQNELWMIIPVGIIWIIIR